MGLFTKNTTKKVKEPQYYISATNIPTYNYKVYHMKFFERILYFIIGFVVGAAVGYLFYGGIGKDSLGEPTTTTHVLNICISSIVGIIAGRAFVPVRMKQIVESQIRKLNKQFRDFLEAFNTSLGAGKNVVDSFHAVYEDLKVQYDEGSYIVEEVRIIISGIANNVDIEVLLMDFGRRSGIDDIKSFANVFKISYRKGGNIKDIIRSTHDILSDKMEITEEIETVVSANKLEQKIMIFMPIALIAVIKMMSPDFAKNFVTLSGILSTTVAVIMFVVAYAIGRVILDIKV